MAFMAVSTSAGSTADRVPVLAYNAKSGRLALHDRMQGNDGKWCTVKTDVTRSEPAFSVDFGTLEVGFIHFASDRAPLFVLAPYGQPGPSEPESPGIDASTGKPLRCKPGFRVPVIGRAIGGVREFAGNSVALITGMNALHDDYESAPEARAGKLPLVKMTDVLEIRSGATSNYQPVFEIVSWVDRLDAALGPRTVAAPGGGNVRAQPARTAAPATRYAARNETIETQHASSEPPAGRWGDDGARTGRNEEIETLHVLMASPWCRRTLSEAAESISPAPGVCLGARPITTWSFSDGSRLIATVDAAHAR